MVFGVKFAAILAENHSDAITVGPVHEKPMPLQPLVDNQNADGLASLLLSVSTTPHRVQVAATHSGRWLVTNLSSDTPLVARDLYASNSRGFHAARPALLFF